MGGSTNASQVQREDERLIEANAAAEQQNLSRFPPAPRLHVEHSGLETDYNRKENSGQSCGVGYYEQLKIRKHI